MKRSMAVARWRSRPTRRARPTALRFCAWRLTLIKTSVNNGVAQIVLARAEKRNALNRELVAALRPALDHAGTDTSVRVIVLRGEGKDFCAGLDLKENAPTDDAMVHLTSARSLADLYVSMRRNSKPIIAAVHGRAIGGG